MFNRVLNTPLKYLFKVNNKDSKTTYREINIEQRVVLVSLLVTLNM